MFIVQRDLCLIWIPRRSPGRFLLAQSKRYRQAKAIDS
jgi:hypothetical protein